jgi:hypothetical protein
MYVAGANLRGFGRPSPRTQRASLSVDCLAAFDHTKVTGLANIACGYRAISAHERNRASAARDLIHSVALGAWLLPPTFRHCLQLHCLLKAAAVVSECRASD